MADSQFTALRPRLFALAYRMLGSVADAEDVLQDTWIAWESADRSDVENPAAYLTRVVTRRSLNRLRQVRRQRETYVGPWLPEPLDTGRRPDEAAEIAESVTYALMVLLEELTPGQRAAYVLVEAFGMSAPEVAEILSSTPAAVRQHLARARRAVRERSPDPSAKVASDAEFQRVSGAFLAALAAGDLEAAAAVLAADVELTTDGGGVMRAALRPIHTPAKVMRFIVGLLNRYAEAPEVAFVELNHRPSFILTMGGEVNAVQFEVFDGLIQRAWVVRNPAKLGDLPG